MLLSDPAGTATMVSILARPSRTGAQKFGGMMSKQHKFQSSPAQVGRALIRCETRWPVEITFQSSPAQVGRALRRRSTI